MELRVILALMQNVRLPFLDIVLSKTQRKTPTVIHKNFKISRIRNFYTRKVKFTQDSFDEKLGSILSDFPVLDDLHPFLSSLMNVLYDKNHYKLALGQLRTARHLIDQVAKDYVRLLKFGDSLYRCKQLKRAALGRMATIMRRQKDPLAYLEQVRQHISRLPAIDPNTRTLIICGYPNVGKSSFINKVTPADVDVQPYAFTTKSLFVGHLDYKYLRWQVIDTPGILGHPLEEMNTIEMQSITALAHLKSCVLYFMDLSEQCGYTIEAQCKLFHSIKPLFISKPTILVLNKSDITTLSSLPTSTQSLITDITSNPTGDHPVTLVECSSARVEGKIKKIGGGVSSISTSSSTSSSVLNRLHVSVPQKRDDVAREAFIPDKVKEQREKGEKMYDKEDPGRRKLLRDREVEEGGAGVFNINLKESYLLADPDWKMDIMPEIMDGKNIADFIDPDIVEKLEALEREEEKLVQEGFYDSDPEDSDFDSLDEEEEQDSRVTEKSRSARLNSQATKKSLKNHAKLIKLVEVKWHLRFNISTKNATVQRNRSVQRNLPNSNLPHLRSPSNITRSLRYLKSISFNNTIRGCTSVQISLSWIYLSPNKSRSD
ncbi:hypothetical protein K435DRAFT_817197 [Dendrothele bispora CBS 962.96]|uniref:Nucleolar GTP-binding protein 1 n=1 Tax=Dendrothele bispora (strain CBS 962.96) TaxID=1314807 RepID=A0A4S8MLG1_DENBC|nr:hypothetical protein K435DRAFT_817197 [Dendrothele bispora CBS 962.96]